MQANIGQTRYSQHREVVCVAGTQVYQVPGPKDIPDTVGIWPSQRPYQPKTTLLKRLEPRQILEGQRPLHSTVQLRHTQQCYPKQVYRSTAQLFGATCLRRWAFFVSKAHWAAKSSERETLPLDPGPALACWSYQRENIAKVDPRKPRRRWDQQNCFWWRNERSLAWSSLLNSLSVFGCILFN